MRRQIGRVRFDQQPIGRNRCRNGAKVIRFLERHHTRKTDVHAQLQTLIGSRLAACKRMHDSDDLAISLVLVQHLENIRLAFAHMNHERLFRLEGKLNVSGKPLSLNFDRTVVPISI